jgi:hypothetical protein
MIWKKGELTGPSFQARRKRRSRGNGEQKANQNPAQLCTYLATWKAVNMTLIAVPILPLFRMSEGDPDGEPTLQEASQRLSGVLADFAKEAAVLAEAGADSYSSTLAYHFRASVDCWYQGREAFSDGHYGLAMQLAECAQDLLDDMPWMKQAFPVPVVLDGIWGADAEEEGVT